MKRNTITTIAAMAMGVLCGCTPEETFVLVDASALKKAANGELASAKVEMVFNIDSKDDPTLPGKIKRAALPYLGPGAAIEIEKPRRRSSGKGAASVTRKRKWKPASTTPRWSDGSRFR